MGEGVFGPKTYGMILYIGSSTKYNIDYRVYIGYRVLKFDFRS